MVSFFNFVYINTFGNTIKLDNYFFFICDIRNIILVMGETNKVIFEFVGKCHSVCNHVDIRKLIMYIKIINHLFTCKLGHSSCLTTTHSNPEYKNISQLNIYISHIFLTINQIRLLNILTQNIITQRVVNTQKWSLYIRTKCFNYNIL